MNLKHIFPPCNASSKQNSVTNFEVQPSSQASEKLSQAEKINELTNMVQKFIEEQQVIKQKVDQFEMQLMDKPSLSAYSKERTQEKLPSEFKIRNQAKSGAKKQRSSVFNRLEEKTESQVSSNPSSVDRSKSRLLLAVQQEQVQEQIKMF